MVAYKNVQHHIKLSSLFDQFYLLHQNYTGGASSLSFLFHSLLFLFSFCFLHCLLYLSTLLQYFFESTLSSFSVIVLKLRGCSSTRLKLVSRKYQFAPKGSVQVYFLHFVIFSLPLIFSCGSPWRKRIYVLFLFSKKYSPSMLVTLRKRCNDWLKLKNLLTIKCKSLNHGAFQGILTNCRWLPNTTRYTSAFSWFYTNCTRFRVSRCV